MGNLHARAIAQLDGLTGERVGTGNHCLRGNDRGQGGQDNQRQQRPLRGQHEKGIFNGLGVQHQQCTLAEIIQHQCRQHQAIPGAADRCFAEVAHVGIQRLGPGQCQYHRTQGQIRTNTVLVDEAKGMQGVDGGQYSRGLQDLQQSQHAYRAEPESHDRPEQHADTGGTEALQDKQENQHHDGQGQDVRTHAGAEHFQPLGR